MRILDKPYCASCWILKACMDDVIKDAQVSWQCQDLTCIAIQNWHGSYFQGKTFRLNFCKFLCLLFAQRLLSYPWDRDTSYSDLLTKISPELKSFHGAEYLCLAKPSPIIPLYGIPHGGKKFSKNLAATYPALS